MYWVLIGNFYHFTSALSLEPQVALKECSLVFCWSSDVGILPFK